MAAKKKQPKKAEKQVKYIPYRDSKGRFRNALKITPENQERLYKNQPLEVKPVFTKEVRKKKTKKVNGKTKIYFETTIKYVDAKGKKATAAEFSQFNYLRELNPENKQIIRTYEMIGFALIPELKNSINKGVSVKFKNKDYAPDELYQFIKELRENISNRTDKENYPTYEIQEQENGNLIITEVINEDESEDLNDI